MSSLSLIHPDIKRDVYLGSAALALSAAAPFLTSSESVKIIAMATIFGFGTMFLNYMLAYRGEKVRYLTVKNEIKGEAFDRPRMVTRFLEDQGVELLDNPVNFKKKDAQSEDRLIRSSNSFVNHCLLSIKTTGFFTLAGCALACAARAPFARLTVKIDAKVLIVPLLVSSGIGHFLIGSLNDEMNRNIKDPMLAAWKRSSANFGLGMIVMGVSAPLMVLGARAQKSSF